MPFIVAVNPSEQILGYAYVYPWKERAAYRFTVENSIYLGPASTGKGLGQALLARAHRPVEGRGHQGDHRGDRRSRRRRIHRACTAKFGFKEIGHMGRVGFKFDRWLGTILMQKSLKK